MQAAPLRRLAPIAIVLTLVAIITAVLASPLTRLADAAPVAPDRVAAPCLLGETRLDVQSAVFGENFLDAVFVLVNPADCAGCQGSVVVQNAVATLAPQGTDCSVTLRATMVGAGGNQACPTPDTTVVLCPPATGTFTNPANVPFDAVIPMSQPCCISGPAFLRIEILSSDCPNGRGFRAVRTPCISCRTYTLLNLGGGLMLMRDSCSDQFNWRVFVQADCCGATPSRRGTWGSMKTLYR